MKNGSKVISSIVVLGALSVSAHSQIVKPWWEREMNASNAASPEHWPGHTATLGNGAFVETFAGYSTTEGLNTFVHGLYRNGTDVFGFQLFAQAGLVNETPRAMITDRFGSVTVVTTTPQHGINLVKLNPNGSTAWTHTISGNIYTFNSATTDRDGNVYVSYKASNLQLLRRLNASNGSASYTTEPGFLIGKQVTKIVGGEGAYVYAIGTSSTPDLRAVIVRIAKDSGAATASYGYPLNNPISSDVELDSNGVPYWAFSGDTDTKVVVSMNLTTFFIDKIYRPADFYGQDIAIRDLAVDNQGNVVVAIDKAPGTPNGAVGVARLTPNLDISYQTTLDDATTDEEYAGLKVDRFGEAYVLMLDKGASTVRGKLTKVSTAGTSRWTQPVQFAGASVFPVSLTMQDKAGDIMVQSYRQTPTGITIQLNAFQQSPVAIADGFNVVKNTIYKSPRPLVDNDRFPLGVTVRLVNTTSNGTLALQGNGHFTYTPATNFTGTDTFSYKLERPGLNPSTTTVQLHVN